MKIDLWTLAFQLVNVLILLGLLAHFFFRPVAAMVKKRQDEIASRLQKATESREEAERLKAEREKALADVDEERDRLITEAEKEAGARKTAILDAAAAEAAGIRTKAEAAIAREREAAERAVTGHAAELAVAIATRLLQRVPPAKLAAAFLDGLVHEIAALPDERRQGLGAVRIVSAAPLGARDRTAFEKALAKAIGGEADVSFSVDPALIAGLECHAEGLHVKNSWRADLGVIAREVAGE